LTSWPYCPADAPGPSIGGISRREAPGSGHTKD
jgi:hypothetical protein